MLFINYVASAKFVVKGKVQNAASSNRVVGFNPDQICVQRAAVIIDSYFQCHEMFLASKGMCERRSEPTPLDMGFEAHIIQNFVVILL